MFWLKIIRDLIGILREGQSPRQAAGGFMLGAMVGFCPTMTLQSLLIWLLILILNVNLGAALLALTFCSLFAYLLDPFFHWLGYQILVQIDVLQPLWTSLYNQPIAPLTRFYNTVVMGSFFTASILAAPIYFGFRNLVVAYRGSIGARVEKLKIYQIIKKSSLAQFYFRVRDLGGLR